MVSDFCSIIDTVQWLNKLFILGEPAAACREAIQTKISEFRIEARFEKTWQLVLEMLGKPISARLTSQADLQFLDIYY